MSPVLNAPFNDCNMANDPHDNRNFSGSSSPHSNFDMEDDVNIHSSDIDDPEVQPPTLFDNDNDLDDTD